MQNVQTKKRATAVKAGNTTGKSWSITNNTDADLLVISASSADDQFTDQFYEQSINVLETTDGSKVIGKGTSGAIALNAAGYNLIIARADNLFPVKTASVMWNDDTQMYPSLTVTTEDAGRTKLAAKFQQMLTAFPTSSLAADYATALADSDATKAAAFFKATDDYKTLTIDDVVAVQTYYTVYPFVWAYYGADKTYGLHATDGVTNKYVGYISLTNECPVPMNSDKSIPGFTITYTNGDASQPLYYSNGQFVDDVNSASPGICLQGLFVLKSSLTKSDDDKVVVAVLVGIINGESVLGYDEEQASQNDGLLKDVSSSLDILLHSDIAKYWLELAGVTLATLLGLAVLAKVFKVLNDKAFPPRDPLTPEEMRDHIREVTQHNLDRMKDLGIKDSATLKIPEDVNASLDSIKWRGNDLLLKENKAKMQDIVNRQSDMLERLAEYSSNPKLQDVGDKVGDIYETLLVTNAEDLGGSIEKLMNDLQSNATVLSTEISSVQRKFSADDRRAIEAANEAVETLSRQVENIEELRADLAENKTPEERQFEELFEAF